MKSENCTFENEPLIKPAQEGWTLLLTSESSIQNVDGDICVRRLPSFHLLLAYLGSFYKVLMEHPVPVTNGDDDEQWWREAPRRVYIDLKEFGVDEHDLRRLVWVCELCVFAWRPQKTHFHLLHRNRYQV
jgi:hypothetical protein